MGRPLVSPTAEEHPAVPSVRVSSTSSVAERWLPAKVARFMPPFILALGEALLLSWWLLWLADLARPGFVSTIWNLNWLLLAALILVALGLILGAKTGRINSLVAIISGILITLIIWQGLGDFLITLLAPVAGLIIFVLFKFQNHD